MSKKVLAAPSLRGPRDDSLQASSGFQTKSKVTTSQVTKKVISPKVSVDNQSDLVKELHDLSLKNLGPNSKFSETTETIPLPGGTGTRTVTTRKYKLAGGSEQDMNDFTESLKKLSPSLRKETHVITKQSYGSQLDAPSLRPNLDSNTNLGTPSLRAGRSSQGEQTVPKSKSLAEPKLLGTPVRPRAVDSSSNVDSNINLGTPSLRAGRPSLSEPTVPKPTVLAQPKPSNTPVRPRAVESRPEEATVDDLPEETTESAPSI